MRAGQLRHRISIVRSPIGGGRSEFGEPVGGEVEVWSGRAAIESVSGLEAVQAQQVTAEVSHVLHTRYTALIEPSHEVHFGTRRFQILAVVDPEERRRELRITAKEIL